MNVGSNSAQAQFFINHGNNPRLDAVRHARYAVFGSVVSGMM